MVRLSAASSLGKLGCEPRKFMPLLIESLEKGDSDTLDYKLEILTLYTNDAQAAVPILLSILDRTPESTNSTNNMIRGQVLNALRLINPESAARFAPPDPK